VGDRENVEVVTYGPEQWLTLVLILAVFSEALPRKRAFGILPCVTPGLASLRRSRWRRRTGPTEKASKPS
jgi:hypothetical protein